MAISTNGTIITRLAGALYGEYLSNASYTELNATAASTVAANMLSNDFAGKTDLQVATTILTNLGLTSITGLDNWLSAQLTAAGSTAADKGAALVSILNGYANMTTDATYGSYATSFNAKVEAGLVKSQTAGAAGGAFANADAVAVSNQTFTLTTTSAGASNGGAGEDTFIALDNALTQYVVDGGAGVDALTATISATDSYDVRNIEALNFKVTGTSTIDMDDFSGEESVAVSGTADTTLNNFNDGVALSSALTGTTTLTVGVASGVEEISVTLKNATSTGLMTIDDVVTINVAGTNDDDSISLDGDAVETLNLSGSTDMTVVTPVGAELTTIDASAMTGDLTLGVTANDIAVTTGSGDDTVTMAANSLDEDDTIDLGEGSDILALTPTTNVYASVATGETLAVSGVETLSLTAAAVNDAIDFDIFADPTQFTSILVTSTADAATITLTDIQTSTVSIRNTNNVSVSDTITAVTYDLKDSTGTADSVTFNLTNRDTTENFTITTLTAAAIESMTINTVGGTDGDIDITNFTATSLESLTVTGDADLTLSAFATTVETVDASASTGDLNFTFAGADVTLTGGSGDDTFVFAATLDEDDTIDAGDGTDVVSVTNINDGVVLDVVLELANVEELTFIENESSDSAFTADLRNATSLLTFNITAEEAADVTLSFENIASGAMEVNIVGAAEADGDVLVFDRDSDTSADSVEINLAVGVGTAVFEGTITVNDEETITLDTAGSTGTATDDTPVTLADLDASDATSVTFTNDDTWDAGDVFVLTTNSIKTGATIDFTGYNQSIGNAAAAIETAAGAEAVDDGTDMYTAVGFTAVASGSYTILLGDGRTEDADVETVIDLGTSNTKADIIRFVDSTADTTNDIGVVLINNFVIASGTIATNRSLLDVSAFGIEAISDLTFTALETGDGDDAVAITAATSTDFAGAIVLNGIAATSLSAADFIFA